MADSVVTIVGNVTRDPELRYANSGTTVVKMGVAVNFRRQNRQSGEMEEETSFFDVTAFGSLAENVGASLTKGNRVVVTGRLQQRSYETQQGEKRSAVEILADEIAPSLRWAQAKVERNERSDSGSGGGRPVPNQDRGPSTPSYASDEEPF
ncbi:MAG: single-stranded DNA-binding protein [Acidimicrobiia bacterium]|nr:single-stranded DNA-binding protein [Acidimicrobiia bacterium]